MDDLQIAETAVRGAQAQSYGAEAFLQRTEQTRVQVHRGEVESFSRAVRRGLGLRLERGGRVGTAFTTDLSEAGIAAALQRAAAVAAVAEPREASVLAEPAPQLPPDGAFCEAALRDLPDVRRVALARAAEEAAFAADPRVAKCEAATYEDVLAAQVVVNSRGVRAAGEASAASLAVEVVAAGGGDERTGHHAAHARGAGGLDALGVGRAAARHAVELLGSRQAETFKGPVLLDPVAATALLSLLAVPLSAEECLLGSSPLAGRVGQRVAAPLVRIVDDPFHAGGIGGMPFDAEGVPARATPLVEDGELRSLLHSSYSARRMGVAVTANAARDDFAAAVRVAPTNLVLLPGRRALDALRTQIARGFEIQDLMGLHTANAVTLDFSLGLVGHWIEGGRRAYPVGEMTVAGNLLELLQRIVEVGSDLWFDANVGCPSLLVDGLTVSGR
jgi:PmbA protein